MNTSTPLVALFLSIFGLLLTGCDSSGPNGSDEETVPATVQFAEAGATVSESTTATIAVEIVDAGNETVSVDVVFDAEASEASGDDVEGFSGKSVSFPAGAEDGTTRNVSVTITLDNESEDTETATFTLQNATGDAEIGSPETFDLEIEDGDEAFTPVEVVDLDCPAELETGEEGTFTATINESEATKPISNEWGFGDATTATGLEVTKMYDTADVYTVTFTTSNEGSEDSENCQVEVNEPAGSSGIIYVDADASGTGEGSSWDDAFPNLQDALAEATSESVIAIAGGTYYPDEGKSVTANDREASFSITGAQDGLEVYGGYAGDENISLDNLMLDARDFESNETVLSGDIDGTPSNASGNSYHVLFLDGSQGESVVFTQINGVTVTGGNANKLGSSQDKNGGGLFCDGSGFEGRCSPTLINVTFTNNSALGKGGAIYNDGSSEGHSSPSIANAVFNENTADRGGAIFNDGSNEGQSMTLVPQIIFATFTNNSAESSGGAIFNDGSDGGQSSPEIISANFIGNSVASGSGGAIYNNGFEEGQSSPTIVNTTFIGNSTSGSSSRLLGGGAIYNDGNFGNSSPIIRGAIFSGNHSDDAGGAVYNRSRFGSSSPSFVNTTFSNNSSGSDGGAVYTDGTRDGFSTVEFTNSILFGNSASNRGEQIFNREAISEVSYSLIESGCSNLPSTNCGAGNISGDPLFRNAVGPDGTPGTTDDNLRLQSGSPAVDVGNNDAVPSTLTEDLDGDPRIQGGTVDLGAYER